MRLTRIFIWGIAGTFTVAVAAGLFLKRWQNERFIYGEDGLFEHASAVFFFLACALAIVHLFRAGSRGRLTTIVAGLGLVAALEEISYGLRWFGDVDLPSFYGMPLDGLHDTISYFVYWYKFDSSQSLVAALAVITFLGLALEAYRYRERIFGMMRSVMRDEASRFVAIAIALIMVALLLDAPIFDYDPLQRLEEGFEMLAGLALLLAAVSLNKEIAASKDSKLQSLGSPPRRSVPDSPGQSVFTK